MLRHLRIRNFAIIDDLSIDLEPGLNVLTGETGAGKSIIIDALGLALGERAQSEMIKSGRDEAFVEAYFEPSISLDEIGIDCQEGIIIRRVISSTGRSRGYINDTLVSIQTIHDVGQRLIDIHGQHEHQSLLRMENQRSIVDDYGRLGEIRREVEALFSEVQSLKKEIDSLRNNIAERERRIDFLRYQISEIESASLRSGEKEALLSERAILSNLARLNDLVGNAYLLIASGDGAAKEKVSVALSRLRDASAIDHGLGDVVDMLESVNPLLEEVSISLRRHLERYELDPDRLNAIEERLDLIGRLERKYGNGIEEVLRFRDEAIKELNSLTHSDERLQNLEEEYRLKEEALNKKAQELSKMRKQVSKKIEEGVNGILKELAMERANLSIVIRPSVISSSGCDIVEFLFSANSGEMPKSLSRTASGGELSRLMLALKEVLAHVDSIPVLIFDEIDAGIGGRVAENIARRLKNLSKRHQVLCVTHLPQIAALADHHLVIEKIQKKEGVYVKVKEPTTEERVVEIARMLSGKVTDISMRHARELLERM
jgi:DNA repair protein RecN (Recombination protein N)